MNNSPRTYKRDEDTGQTTAPQDWRDRQAKRRSLPEQKLASENCLGNQCCGRKT